MILNIATEQNRILTCGRDNALHFWDLSKRRGMKFEGHSNWVSQCLFSDFGYVSGGADRTIRIWNEDSCDVLRDHRAAISALKLAQPNRLLSGSMDFTVKLWDLDRKRCIRTHNLSQSTVNNIEIDEDKFIFSGAESNQFFVIDMETGIPIYQETPAMHQGQRFQRSEIRSLVLNQNTIITGETRSVRIWDMRQQNPVQQLRPQTANQTLIPSTRIPIQVQESSASPRGIFKMSYKPNLNLLTLGCMGMLGLVCMDTRIHRQIYCQSVHQYPIAAAAFGKGPMEGFVATSGSSINYQYKVVINSLPPPPALQYQLIPGHKAVITAMEFGDDYFVTGGKNGSLHAIVFKSSNTVGSKRKSFVRIINI